MINTIFYFTDTEQEYKDNLVNGSVKPHTICFTKDTKALWRDGVRYSGQNAQEVLEAITDITGPLRETLEESIRLAEETAEHRSQELEDSLLETRQYLNATRQELAAEDARLSSDLENTKSTVTTVNNRITSEVANLTAELQSLDTDIQGVASDLETTASNIQGRLDRGEVTYNTGWNENVKAYMQTVGLWDYGEGSSIDTKWSQLRQSVSGVSSEVNRVESKLDGNVTTLQSAINQEVTDRGTAITELNNTYAQKEADSESVLRWLYSGLKTGTNPDLTYAQLVAASKTGDTSAISNIDALVEEIIDGQGRPTGKYRATSNMTSAVDNAISGILNSTTGDYANSTMISRLDGNIGALDVRVGKTESDIQGIASNSSLTAKFLAKTDFNTAKATLEAADTANSNAIGQVQTQVNVLNGGPEVTNSVAAKVNSSLATFEQNVNNGTACTTLINRVTTAENRVTTAEGNINDLDGDLSDLQDDVNNNSTAIAGLDVRVSGTEQSILNIASNDNLTAKFLAKTDFNTAKAVLEAADTANSNAIGQVQTEVETLNGGPEVTTSIASRVNSAISTFEQNVNNGTACTVLVNRVNTTASDVNDVKGDLTDTNTALTALATYVDKDQAYATLTAKLNDMQAGVVTDVKDDLATAGILSKSGSSYQANVFTKVETNSTIDTKVSTATSGLMAASDFNSASVVAKVNEAGSSVNINADKINLVGQTSFNNAIGEMISARTLKLSDVDGQVKAVLSGGNASFVGNVTARQFLAGDPNALNITMTDKAISFNYGNDTRAWFTPFDEDNQLKDGMFLYIKNPDSSAANSIITIDFANLKFKNTNPPAPVHSANFTHITTTYDGLATLAPVIKYYTVVDGVTTYYNDSECQYPATWSVGNLYEHDESFDVVLHDTKNDKYNYMTLARYRQVTFNNGELVYQNNYTSISYDPFYGQSPNYYVTTESRSTTIQNPNTTILYGISEYTLSETGENAYMFRSDSAKTINCVVIAPNVSDVTGTVSTFVPEGDNGEYLSQENRQF